MNAAYRGYADGSADFFGDQIEVITGYSREDFLSRKIKWTEIIHSEDRTSAKETLKQALKTDKTYMREYRIITRDGDIRWVQEWGQIVCDDAGKIEYIIGAILDITDQKHEEEFQARIASRSGKYLIFRMNNNNFGLPIKNVREIVGFMPITPIPESSEYILGVINLRGRIVPVLDLRKYYDIANNIAETSCIIITECTLGDIPFTAGILVDEVCEVIYLKGEDIEEIVDFYSQSLSKGVFGVAKLEKRMIILLLVDRIFSTGLGEILSTEIDHISLNC